jgi:hypothetical protein
MTLEDLRRKKEAYKEDERSIPALELPARSRIEKAKKLAGKWHGRLVRHPTRGVGRYSSLTFWKRSGSRYLGQMGRRLPTWDTSYPS